MIEHRAVTIIGLDAASQREKFGFAVARYSAGVAEISKSGLIGNDPNALAEMADCIRSEPTLIAIDAPLGWPDGMRASVRQHLAGERLDVAKDAMFRRATDRRLRAQGFQPLEVGADRIARAAHEACTVLSELRSISGHRLPLIWDHQMPDTGVVEVYPAATLKRSGLPYSKYKQPEGRPVRQHIALALEPVIRGMPSRVDASTDEFDACLCILAGVDFLSGRCAAPSADEEGSALREGWIWLRSGAIGRP